MPLGITQCYLPPGRGDIPALTASQSWYSIKRPRRDARLPCPYSAQRKTEKKELLVTSNESVPIQLTQCWPFPVLKYKYIFFK